LGERIGIVVGREESFPRAFLDKVNETPGMQAELARVGGTPERFESPYRVLVDRLSHEVPFYRYHLKAAALSGTFVVNDPFWWSADEKFFGYSLAARLGVAVPRTVMLPQRSYIAAIDPGRSLRNLEYPLDWDALVRHVGGFPAVLKPADGGGWRGVSVVRDMPELMAAYDASGTTVMTLQEFIDFDEYVRCLCIGREFFLPIKYDPRLIGRNGLRGAYVDVDGFMPPALEKQVLDGAWALNHALGYDMNSVEFACRGGVPYAIDFTNPAPDMDVGSLGERYFRIVVDEMARFAIRAAREGRTNHDGYAFRRFLASPTARPAGLCEYAPVATAPAA